MQNHILYFTVVRGLAGSCGDPAGRSVETPERWLRFFGYGLKWMNYSLS